MEMEATDLELLEEFMERHLHGATMREVAEAFPAIARRTLNRRLASLVYAGKIDRRGERRATVYYPIDQEHTSAFPRTAQTQFESTDGSVQIELSAAGRDILKYVFRATSARKPVGYALRFLDEYQPNRTAYLSESIRARLHKIGQPISGERAHGTFAKDILSRLLIDLSWSSSRLEGNTYSRLDTQRLIEFGQAAEGKDAKETQMILNHKAAIELIVDEHEDIGINRYTLLNLHALLSEELMPDPEASGRLRRRPVEIGKSVYIPLAVPQVVEERFNLLLEKAAAIQDPFEQAFFMMVQVPYLQPFEDVNKRVSRLAANIPLAQQNLCPLSFIDVPERAYILGTLGVYELTRVELLRDLFVWAYERSCQKYVVVRDSVAEPDVFRMKYRAALAEVVGDIVRGGKAATTAEITRRSRKLVDPESRDKFVQLVSTEFARLYEGNTARYRIRLGEYLAWRKRRG